MTYMKWSPGVYYPAKFIGVGNCPYHDDDKRFDNVATIGDCLSVCYNKLVREGVLWNGVEYYVPSKHCYCNKHDTTHTDVAAGGLHYRFM